MTIFEASLLSTPHLSAPTTGQKALWRNFYIWLLACGTQLQLLGNTVKKPQNASDWKGPLKFI